MTMRSEADNLPAVQLIGEATDAPCRVPRVMTARILVGTASWADKPLVESGKFYPPEAKSAEQRLRYYALLVR